MILIVGLGNPEEKYENTRHNLGFMAVEALAQKMMPASKTEWKNNAKFDAQILKINEDLILVRPQTFMNASGFAVAKIISFYKIEPKNIWVLHDEMDIPVGKFKIKNKGGSAGHRGVASIIEQLGTTEFVRFRLGIGQPGQRIGEDKIDNYVLAQLPSKDLTEVRKMIKKTIEAIVLALEKGIDNAANRFNS